MEIVVSRGCAEVVGVWLRRIGPCLIYDISFRATEPVHAALSGSGCGEATVGIYPWSLDLFGGKVPGVVPTFLTFPLSPGQNIVAASTVSDSLLRVVITMTSEEGPSEEIEIVQNP